MLQRLPELCRLGMRIGVAGLLVGRLCTATEGAVLGQTLGWGLLSLLLLIPAGLALSVGLLPLPRFRRIDAIWLVLCLSPIVSAAVHFGTGDDRAAVNLVCEWLGLLATWFLLRLLQCDTAAANAWPRLVAATTVGLSLLGIWQHHFGYAADRAEYLALINRQTALRTELAAPNQPSQSPARRELAEIETLLFRLGVPDEGPGRKLWEARLLSSNEPVGLFALANTLAGVLLVGTVVWGLWALMTFEAGRTSPAMTSSRRGLERLPTCLALGVVGFCLVLTKSRTAWGGTLAAVVLLALQRGTDRSDWFQGRRPRILGFVLVGLALLIGLAVWSGGLDRLVFSEAFKSLRYRAEYWTASWRMLWDREHPTRWLTGVGPGNFRVCYLPFKLPESSEEIADPHNLLLDHWSAGGLPGLLAVLALWGVAVVSLRKTSRGGLPLAETPALSGQSSQLPDWLGAVGAVGVLALLGTGLNTAWPLTVVAAGLLMGAWASPRVSAGLTNSNGAILAGLLIHLLAAGGMGMPAIVMLLQLFSLPRRAPQEQGDLSVAWPGLLLSGLGALLAGSVITQGLRPVVTAELELALGDEALARGATDRGLKAYRAAAQADRLSPLPLDRLAAVMQRDWLATRDPQAFEKCLRYRQASIRRNPLAASGWRALGETWRLHFSHTSDPADARQAVDHFRQAVSRHPTNPMLQAELAQAQAAAGDAAAARSTAKHALGLDELNQRLGHTDKLLPEPLVQTLRLYRDAPDSKP
jgi:hypothetical protein